MSGLNANRTQKIKPKGQSLIKRTTTKYTKNGSRVMQYERSSATVTISRFACEAGEESNQIKIKIKSNNLDKIKSRSGVRFLANFIAILYFV